MAIEIKMTKEQIENLATIIDTFSTISEVDLIKEDDGKIFLKILLPGEEVVDASGNDQ